MTGLPSDWSGRRSTKRRTDDYPSIDVREMARNFKLDTYVILAGGVLTTLEWKQCHFGGTSPYFKYPNSDARACILYRCWIESGQADQYGCQKCLDMVHPVENEGELERAVRRNHKAVNRRIYDRSRPAGKPLWMRWSTWARLSHQFTESAIVRFEQHERIIKLLKRFDQPKPARERNK